MLYLIMPVTVKRETTGAENPGTRKNELQGLKGNFMQFFKETPQLNLIWH